VACKFAQHLCMTRRSPENDLFHHPQSP
jgi:hypothetical protein